MTVVVLPLLALGAVFLWRRNPGGIQGLGRGNPALGREVPYSACKVPARSPHRPPELAGIRPVPV